MSKEYICNVKYEENRYMDSNIQKYIAFVKTVEYGSFSKAGEMLSYSQSGISRMIADLERECNISLLERDRTGVRLTSDGIKLLPYAKSICEEYYKFKEQVDQINGVQKGLIRIGTFSSIATHRLPKIIKKFREDYPEIEYEMLLGDYTEIENWIAEGRVDCGFLRLPTRKEFDTIFFEQDELMAVIPQNHPMADLDKFPISQFEKEPFMLLEKGGKFEISKIFQENNITPNVCFKTWDDYAIMSMVEQGLGISILPSLILNRIPYKITCKHLDVSATRNIAIALKNKKTLSQAVKKFLQYL